MFLEFHVITHQYQSSLALRSPVLVGLFLSRLVVHGGLQQWWIEPVLGGLSTTPLLLSSIALTAFNDNAAITYLSSLVPGLNEGLKYAVVAGAVTGGGLTVIANAPNPAGQSILARFFSGHVSPLGLLAGSLLPTLILACCILLFPRPKPLSENPKMKSKAVVPIRNDFLAGLAVADAIKSIISLASIAPDYPAPYPHR